MLDNNGRHKLKVSGFWNGVKYVVLIRLKGEWLERTGFNYGDEFYCDIENGKLIISKVL